MKRLLRRLFRLQNLLPGVIILGALLGPLGLHQKIGLTIESLILALFGLLALDSLVARAGLLTEIHEGIGELRSLSSRGQAEFFSNSTGIAPVRDALGRARDITICGISLGRTITTFSELLRERIEKGARVTVVLTNPKLDQPGVVAAANRSLNIDSPAAMAAHIQNSVASIRGIYGRLSKKRQQNLRLQVVDFPTPYSLIALDTSEPYGSVFVELYGCKVDPAEDPAFLLGAQDGKWFGFFARQAAVMVGCGTSLDLSDAP